MRLELMLVVWLTIMYELAQLDAWHPMHRWREGRSQEAGEWGVELRSE